jgi:hypothetical protein
MFSTAASMRPATRLLSAGSTLGPKLRHKQVQRVQRLAQVVARYGEEARLGQVCELELLGAFIDFALQRRVGTLELRCHVVELLTELLELIAGLDGEAVIERPFPDACGT